MEIPVELLTISAFLVFTLGAMVFFVAKHIDIGTPTPVEFDMGIDLNPNSNERSSFFIIHDDHCQIDGNSCDVHIDAPD